MTNRNTGNVTVQVLALPKNHMAADNIPDDISQITTIQHLIWYVGVCYVGRRRKCSNVPLSSHVCL